MITENEARAKWCPYASALGTLVGRESANIADRVVAVGPQNRGYAMGGALDNCKCLASECMAWRWAGQAFEFVTMDNRAPHPERRGWLTHSDAAPPPPAGEGWEPCHEPRQADGYVTGVLQQQWRRPYKFRKGFCGLAGSTGHQP